MSKLLKIEAPRISIHAYHYEFLNLEEAHSHPYMYKIEDISALQSWLNDLKSAPIPWTYFSFEKDKSYGETSTPQREPILDYGDQGFLIRNLLSPKECQQLIESSDDIGFSAVDNLPDCYRSNKRIVGVSETLAETLWLRVSPFLKKITVTGDHRVDHIFGNNSKTLKGVWTPYELNPLFRICRYNPDEHFAPHCDSFLQRSESGDRSLQTFMLYLNGPLDGGCTNFLRESQIKNRHMDESGRLVAKASDIEYSVEPEAGLAIVFNHHRPHEGEPLRSGVKYILRTDIMFTKKTADNGKGCSVL